MYTRTSRKESQKLENNCIENVIIYAQTLTYYIVRLKDKNQKQ